MTDSEKFERLYDYINNILKLCEAECDLNFAEDQLNFDKTDFTFCELAAKRSVVERIRDYAEQLNDIHAYKVRVFARVDTGKTYPRYKDQGLTSGHGREDDAIEFAEFLAKNDACVRRIGDENDGYAVVVYEDDEPVRCFEHDGISLTTWVGCEMSDDFRM